MTAQFLDQLLAEVQKRFYAKARPQTYFAHRKQLINALTWPAAWLRGHGFRSEVTASAYRHIILDVLAKIQQHGQPPIPGDPNGFFPSYLLKCIQDHCRCNAEDVLGDLKALRNRVDWSALTRAIERGGAQPTAVPPADFDVQVLAEAHSLLALKRHDRPAIPADRAQALLF
jgi:hypothetical protein